MVAHLEDVGSATRQELTAASGGPGHVAQRQLQHALRLGFIVAETVDGEQRYTLPDERVPVEAIVGESPAEEPAEQFDPTAHTVAEVREYLATADDAEVQRVMDAERASPTPRVTILND